MNFSKKEIIKNFTIGFFPIIIFLAAEIYYGVLTGIIVSLAFGLLEFLFLYVKNKKIEKFILFDIGLLVLFGVVSLLLKNDFFFKIKPAVFELIMVAILSVHGFTNRPIMLMIAKRYLPDMHFQPLQLKLIKTISKILAVIFLIHILLIVWSAWYWSEEAWAFISGGLFYIIFGLFFVGQIIYSRFIKKKLMTHEEWFDIVDKNGNVLGKGPRSQIHGNPKLIHPTVHIHVFNKKGLLFLQKRVQSKDLYPGRWDTSVGGHVSSGESIQHALLREAKEELGIDAATAQPLFRYVMTNSWESELIHTYKIIKEGPFSMAADEIDEGRFWTAFEIERNIGKDVFTPNFEKEFRMLQQLKLI